MSSKQRQQDMLVAFFVRHAYPQSIPIVLTKLIKSFYDVYVYWTLRGAELQRFRDALNGDVMYGKPFMINDIEFHCTLCPNGYRSNANGNCQFYAEITSLPSLIENVTFYTELCCETTGTFCRAMINHRRCPAGIGWNHHEIKHSEVINVDRLSFHCMVELRYVKFKTDKVAFAPLTSDENKNTAVQTSSSTEKTNEPKSDTDRITDVVGMDRLKARYSLPSLPIKPSCQFVWKMDEHILAQCKALKYGQRLFSRTFENGVWGVRLFKDYDPTNGDKECIQFHLGCFSYPRHIHTMDVAYTISHALLPDGESLYNTQQINDRKAVMLWTMNKNTRLFMDVLETVNELCVYFDIDILTLYDENNRIIERSDATFDQYFDAS